jgi:hypothetical protein
MKRVLLLAALALPACGQDVQPNPAPTAAPAVDAATDTIDPATDAAGLTPTEAGPLRRTVMTRSPFGNLARTDNLLLDGDMEMSIGAGQSPWRVLGTTSQVSVPLETGGKCRSGLRCIALSSAANAALGVGVAARNLPLEFWLWAKVPASCDAVSVYLFSGMTMNITMFNQVKPESDQPDASGWCRFHALRSPMNESVGIYVETDVSGFQHVLIDDAVLRPADGSSPTTKALHPVRPDVHARIVQRLAPLWRERWIGPPPCAIDLTDRTGTSPPCDTPPRTSVAPPASR